MKKRIMTAGMIAMILAMGMTACTKADSTAKIEKTSESDGKKELKKLSFAVLMMQGIATSIDALSVGFTIAEYGLIMAVVCSLIVAVVTFVICETGLYLGKTLGTKLSGKADVLGGVILIGIGIVSWGRGM